MISTDWERCGSVRSRCPTALVGGTAFAQAEAIEMSLLMNNRGLMERVVLEVGLDLGVIPRAVFAMRVFMGCPEHGHHRSLARGVGTTRGVPLPDGDTALMAQVFGLKAPG